MLSTDFAAVALAILALLLAAAALWRASIAVQYGIALQKWAKDAADPVGRRRIAELEATVTELSDAYDALLTSHKKLRARIGMRHNRLKGAGAPEDLDVGSTRDKAALRMHLRRTGQLP